MLTVDPVPIPDDTCYPATLQPLLELFASKLSSSGGAGGGGGGAVKVIYVQTSQPSGVPEEVAWFEPVSGTLKLYGKSPGDTVATWKPLKFPDGYFNGSVIAANSIQESQLTADVRSKIDAVSQISATSVQRFEQQFGGGSARANFFVMTDGTLRCCGKNSNTKNGTGSVGSSVANFLPKRCGFSPPLNGDKVAKVYAMQAATFAVTEAGLVYSCGYNHIGQLGLGDSVDRTVFTRINPTFFVDPVAELAIGTNGGNYLSCYARTTTGNLYSWGHNWFGQLGLGGATSGNTSNQNTPTQVTLPGGALIKQIVSAGSGIVDANGNAKMAAYAVTTTNTLLACGWNGDGNLGIGSTTGASSFVAVSGVTNITKVVACGDATHISVFVVMQDPGTLTGTVKSMGYNACGQLGIGSTTAANTPQLCLTAPTGKAVVDLKAFDGSANTSVYAILGDGSVRSWGKNTNGQLGLGSGAGTGNVTSPATPVVQDAASNNLFVDAIRVGGNGGLVSVAILCRVFTGFDSLNPQYNVYSCGHNISGTLGLGDGTNRPLFTQVLLDTTNIADIAFGANNDPSSTNTTSMLVQIKNGSVLACGYDSSAYGQLGVDANPGSISVPAFVNF